MDVRNCKNCGKLFQYVGKPLCPACNKKLEDKFFEVRDYIYENPTANRCLRRWRYLSSRLKSG